MATGRAYAVQQRSTATSWTARGFEGLRSVADLPQRPRMTSPPRVRIERITADQLTLAGLNLAVRDWRYDER